MTTNELVQHYTRVNKHRRLSKGNMKVAAHVGIFNLPAVHSCLNCKDCLDTCYARQAQIQYPNVREFRNANYHLAKTSPDVLTQLILDQIDKENIKIVRIHESGDFFSYDYVLMWFKIAAQRPRVAFYGYTKMTSNTKHTDIAAAIKTINELDNVNIIDSYIQGNRNFGSREYVEHLKDEYKSFICPAEGCMSDCTYCLTKDNVVFEIHGSLKSRDTYKEEIKERV